MTTGGAGSAGTRPTLAPVFAPDGAGGRGGVPHGTVTVACRSGSAGLAEKLRAYDPKADTGLIDAAYTLAEQAHGTQRRDNGDPYITHPLAVADILAGYRLDTASIATGAAARRDRGHAGQAAGDPDPLRRRDRRPGGRRHQADPAGTAIRPHQAGGELPQAGAGDQPRHPRAAGEARRPAAQHAHAAFRAGRRAPQPHRARDDGDLRAARRTHRHGRGEDRAADAGLRAARSRGLRDHPGAAEFPARSGRRCDRGGARAN